MKKKLDFGSFFFFWVDEKKTIKTGKEYGIEWNKGAFCGSFVKTNPDDWC